MDAATTTPGPAPPSNNDSDSKASLKHILAAEPTMDESHPEVVTADASPPDEPTADSHDADHADGSKSASLMTTTRRNANGSVSSVYSGNKIRHLKKDDGIPLWRKDIQYDFLRHVFEDDRRVFHKVSDGPGGDLYTFADIYLDAMANSSKCSKILKDKLLTERPAAVNMAMVCLLVNVGRMNTTLNFFPEMRAQLRTYHSIPSLQAKQDPNAYKQLQDAPRLKSILKGATEDTEQPSTIEDIKTHAIPRTNPVNLIFVLSQYAPKISEIHFFPPRDFFDLVMRSNLSSRSRATAFLWLMWWYLESDFSKEDALNNPFGPGQYGPEGDTSTGGLPIKCPPFELLTPEKEALENVDTEDEKIFGEIKRKERSAVLHSNIPTVVTGPKRSSKKGYNQNPVFSVGVDEGTSTPGRDRQSPSLGSARGRGSKLAKSLLEREYPSDTENARSASPPSSVYNLGKKSTPNMRITTLLNEDAPSSTPASKGPGRGNWNRQRAGGSSARTFRSKLESQDGQSPSTHTPPVSSYNGPHGFYLPLNGADPSHKRNRPLTQHQQAVEQFRRRRVDVILDRGIRQEYERAAKRRKTDGSFQRAWIRCKGMQDGYDTDEESNIQALQQVDIEVGTKAPPPMFAGLMPLDYGGEVNDYGEEAYNRAKMLTRALRRMDRWNKGETAVRLKEGKGASRSRSAASGAGSGAGWAAQANGDGEAAAATATANGTANGVYVDDEDDDEEMQDAGEGEREWEKREDAAESDEEEATYDQGALPALSTIV